MYTTVKTLLQFTELPTLSMATVCFDKSFSLQQGLQGQAG